VALHCRPDGSVKLDWSDAQLAKHGLDSAAIAEVFEESLSARRSSGSVAALLAAAEWRP